MKDGTGAVNSRFGFFKSIPFEKKRSIAGVLFILPWLIGTALFFVLPFCQSALFTFNNIQFTSSGFKLTFSGLYNYNYVMNSDPQFKTLLPTAFLNMAYQVPIIVFFSLFIAMILKSKFHGRTFCRAIFFFPVIIASGVVMGILSENMNLGSSVTQNLSAQQSSYLFQAPDFLVILKNLGLPTTVFGLLTVVINQMFSLVWKSGVQILLLLAAVNNIPDSSYEAADIEGATEWEKFWKITFPLVSPTLLVAVFYTIIDTFTDYQNQVMRYINKMAASAFYSLSTTMAFIYFIGILIIVGIINMILSKHVFYMSE